MYIPKMSGRTLLFISSLVLLTICNSHPLFKDLELHEDVEVRHVSGRTLRSLNVPGKGFRFPNEMTFVIEKGDMRVPLNMFLDSRPREKAFSMITTRDENGIQRRHSFSTANYAFYHVRNNITTATMKVNCADNQPCTLTGRFNLDNQNYVIEPNTEAPKRTRFVSSHKTYKIRRNDSEKPPVDVVKRVTNKRSGVQDGKRNGEKRQTKNVADVVFEIELAYVVDNSVFDFFAPKHSTASAAIDEIVQLIEFYTFEMYLRFATLRPNLHIRPYPSTVVVFQRAEESTWLQTFTENGNEFADATGTLDNFKNWTKANQALLGQYDLAMTLTNMDLADQGDAANTKNTMGISYSVATDFGDPDTLLCAHLDPNNEFVPAAVSEFSKYGDMSGVVTHEDGHLLGLLHDDEVGCGTAANPEYYVMHSSLSVNILIEYADHPWKFSTCSQTALTSALQSLLDSTPAGSKSCVEETAFTYEDYITFVTQTESGFSTYDDLCQKFLNVNACTVQKPDEVCHKGVPCISPNGGCEMVTETHGLTCGTGMTCQLGICSELSLTPATPARPPTEAPTTAAPEPSTAAPEPTTVAPAATTAAPAPTTAAPAPTTAAAAPTTATPAPTTAAPAPTTEAPAPTTAAPAPTTAAAAPTTAAPAPTTAAPAPTTAAPAPTTAAAAPTTAAPAPTTAAPAPTTAAPAPTTAAPAPTTTASQCTRWCVRWFGRVYCICI